MSLERSHRGTIALLLAAAACAGPRSEPAHALARLRPIVLASERDRPLADLDLSGDGRLDAADWGLFASVARAAHAELGRRGISLAVRDGLYHGPDAGSDSVLARLRFAGGEPMLASLSDAELRVLAVETRWMSVQARMAALAGGPLDARVFGGLLASMLPGYDPGEMRPGAVCAAVDDIDLEPLARAGIDVAAVFDLDSTVWLGNVTDPFLAALVDSGPLHEEANPPLRRLLKTLKNVDAEAIDRAGVAENARLLLTRVTDAGLPPDERVAPKDAFYAIVGLLRGMTEQEAQEVARVAFEVGTPAFHAWADRTFAASDGCGTRRIIEKLAARGVQIYLLSATPDVLAVEAGRLLGVPRTHVLGGLLGLEHGRYTGEVRDSTYYTKGAIVRQWLPAPPILAFGDSPSSDFGMLLEAAMAGFMVNPRPQFLDRDKREAGSRLVSLRFDGIAAEPTKAGH